MKAETVRFGAIDVPEDRVISFPESLPGFAGRRYVIIPEKDAPILEWLQSIDEPDVALMLVDPVAVVPTYNVQPKPAEIRAIKPDEKSSEKITCRVVARGGERPNELCLNLFAPIFFNLERKIAMQVPLVGSGYSVRQVWPPRPDGAETASSEE